MRKPAHRMIVRRSQLVRTSRMLVVPVYELEARSTLEMQEKEKP